MPLASWYIVHRRLTIRTRPRTRDTACCPPDTGSSRGPSPDPDADRRLAECAKALGHPVRVRIIRLLAARDTRMCCHLVDELPLAQSTVSEHLRILRAAGLIRVSDAGPRGGYCLVPSALRELKHLLREL